MRTLRRCKLAMLMLATALAAACTPHIDSETRLQIARDHEQRGDYITAILELKNIVQMDANDVAALTMLGRLSLHAGQSAEAIAHLQRARSLGADSATVLEPLGQALLAQGRFDDVLEMIPVAQVPAPRRGRLWLLHAQAYAHLGDGAAATAAYERAREDRSTEAEALAGLARLALADARFDEAEAAVDAALDADPFSVSAHRTVGALRLAQGRDNDALEAFVRAVEATRVRPGSDDLLLARVGLTEAQWRIGQKSRALGNVKDLLDAYPWHPLPRFLRALLAYDSGEYTLATEYLRDVLAIVPRHEPSQQLLAASEFELGNYASVELLLRDFVRANPGNTAMRRLLAATHLEMGNPPGALAVLNPALASGASDSDLLALYGRASLHNGDAATAAAYLLQASRLDPDDLQTRVSLIVALIGSGHVRRAERELRALPDGELYQPTRELLELALLLRSGQRERALEFAKALRQNAPSSLQAMLALAELAEARGDSTRAIDWLEMAASRNPMAVEPRLLLARYYHDRGDHQLAHARAVEAVQVRPHQADALVALAREKLDLGNTAGAIRTFEEALRASPESGEALLQLAAAAAERRDGATAGELLARAVEANAGLVPRASAIVTDLADAGDTGAALKLAQHLQRIGVDLPHGYSAAGDVHLSERRFEEALAAYESAMRLSDDPVHALKGYIAAREAGRPNPAQLLQQWLEQHPDDDSVRRMLASASER